MSWSSLTKGISRAQDLLESLDQSTARNLDRLRDDADDDAAPADGAPGPARPSDSPAHAPLAPAPAPEAELMDTLSSLIDKPKKKQRSRPRPATEPAKPPAADDVDSLLASMASPADAKARPSPRTPARRASKGLGAKKTTPKAKPRPPPAAVAAEPDAAPAPAPKKAESPKDAPPQDEPRETPKVEPRDEPKANEAPQHEAAEAVAVEPPEPEPAAPPAQPAAPEPPADDGDPPSESRSGSAASNATSFEVVDAGGESTDVDVSGGSSEEPAAAGSAPSSPDAPEQNWRVQKKLLSSEVKALNEELSSYATRQRQLQDRLEEMSDLLHVTQAALQKKEVEIKRFEGDEHALNEALAAKDGQVAALGVKMKEAIQAIQARDDTIADLEEEKDTLLRQQTEADLLHRKELEAAGKETQNAEGRIRELESELSDSSKRGKSRERQLEEDLATISTNLAVSQRALQDRAAEIASVERGRKQAEQTAKALRTEMNEYKSRAAKVLQAKEKEIERLASGGGGAAADGAGAATAGSSAAAAGGGSAASDGQSDAGSARHAVAEAELSQARQQIASLETRLDELSLSLQEAEDRALEDATLATSQYRDAEQALELERARLAEAQKDIEIRDLEVKQLREEIIIAQRDSHRKKLESENAELRRRVEALSNSERQSLHSELEGRLRVTTENLIQKQAMLETALGEKAAMQMQLESERRAREESERERERIIEIGGTHRRAGGELDLGGTDAAVRLRPIVYFDDESTAPPWQQSVNQAARMLDTVSLQTGYYLRRYPIARVAVIAYLILLHIWVLYVLESTTPDLHDQPAHAPQRPG